MSDDDDDTDVPGHRRLVENLVQRAETVRMTDQPASLLDVVASIRAKPIKVTCPHSPATISPTKAPILGLRRGRLDFHSSHGQDG